MCSPSAASHCLWLGGTAGWGCSWQPVPCSPCPEPTCSICGDSQSQNQQKIPRAPTQLPALQEHGQQRVGLDWKATEFHLHGTLKAGDLGTVAQAEPAQPGSSLQGGHHAAVLGALTVLAARGTSAWCRLPAWHRPSPAEIPLLRGWTNPWHLVKAGNTGGERVSAEGVFALSAQAGEDWDKSWSAGSCPCPLQRGGVE